VSKFGYLSFTTPCNEDQCVYCGVEFKGGERIVQIRDPGYEGYAHPFCKEPVRQ